MISKITRVAKDPRVAETKPLYEAPDRFFGNILVSNSGFKYLHEKDLIAP